MLKKWIKYLCDPIDKSSLGIFKITKRIGDDIISGTLRSKSGNSYKISDGVPILLNRSTQSIKSVDSFAYEWKSFDFDFGKQGWLQDIVKPILGSKNYFKNKTVLDCGAGSGRQSLWIAEAGAKFVFSVELSDSARTMVKNVTKKYKNKVFVIQADIAHLPIRKKYVKIDVAYCVNVIQHTRNPLKTIKEISMLLSKETEFIFNIYLKRKNNVLISIVQNIKKLLSKFPKNFIKFVSLIIALVSYPFKSKGNNFKEFWLDAYDLLGTHYYQKFYTEEYLLDLLTKLGLKIDRRSYYVMILKKIKI